MPSQAAACSLIDELEDRLQRGSSDQRADVLRRVTDLFIIRAETISEEQIALFDDVFESLIEEIEQQTLARLSERLALVGNAPTKIIRRLSRHDGIDVAGPVLEKSTRLTDQDLVLVAKSKSQAHLSAIAGRERISPTVTDVLVRRGESPVVSKVAGNPGASFSNIGLNNLVQRAQGDENIAEKVASRPELTPDLLKILVLRATDTVKRRLLAHSNPVVREEVKKVLPAVATEVARTAATGLARQGGYAAKIVLQQDPAQLRSQLADFASVGRLHEMIATFAALTEMPTEVVKRLLQRRADDGVLILCKAAGLGWPAVKAVFALRAKWHPASAGIVHNGFDNYVRLSAEAAQRVLRFLKARTNLSEAEIENFLNDSSRPEGTVAAVSGTR
jgi:uncharacterized protein (DUF2336 family)